MLSDITAYNKIVSLIKKNKCTEAIEIIQSYPGLCIRVQNSCGNNLLHVACLYNRESVAKILFNKMSASKENMELFTPLYYCTLHNNSYLCEFFIRNGVIPDQMSYFNALKMCDLRFIKILFIRKTQFNILDIRKQNLLIHAIKQKRSHGIIDYISSKCDLNQIDIYNNTPMHYAARCLRAGYEKILKLLSTKGADISRRDDNNKSALDYIKNIYVKIEVHDLGRKYGRYYRRKHFLMFLSNYKFLSGTHKSKKLYVQVFSLPEIYKNIMKYV